MITVAGAGLWQLKGRHNKKHSARNSRNSQGTTAVNTQGHELWWQPGSYYTLARGCLKCTRANNHALHVSQSELRAALTSSHILVVLLQLRKPPGECIDCRLAKNDSLREPTQKAHLADYTRCPNR